MTSRAESSLAAASPRDGVRSPISLQWPIAAAGAVLATDVALGWPRLAGGSGFFPTIVDVVMVAGLLGAGLVLHALPAQRNNGLMLLLAATARLTPEVSNLDFGPWQLLGYVFAGAYVVPLAVLLLRWPGSRLTRPQRRLIAVLAVVPTAARLAEALTWQPSWNDYYGPSWWVTVVHDRHLHDAVVTPAAEWLSASLTVVFLAALWRRWRTLRALDRGDVAPLAVAAVVGALSAGTDAGIRAFGLDKSTFDVIQNLTNLALLALPASLVVVALRRRLVRATLADLAVRVSRPDADIRTALRDALADPQLDVLFAVDGELVDASGTVVALDETRLRVPVLDPDGALVAHIVMDASLEHHPAMVEAAVAAAGMALTNARLQAEVLSHLAEVSASRRRIVEAGLIERRRVERDLHDGAQQHLLALAATLGRARATTPTPEAAAVLDEARDQLRRALSELRDLARGVHPLLLTDAGLAAALHDVCRRAPLPVTVSVPERRWPATVETTAYFVVCEALANAAKHSRGSYVSVTISGADPVTVEVTDDGIGGALESGSGLRGLRDRVNALGGELTVHSPPGHGTSLWAVLPCG